jgi:hypothetical protein
MNLLVVGTVVAVVSIGLMSSNNKYISIVGMFLLIVAIYVINKGRNRLGSGNK